MKQPLLRGMLLGALLAPATVLSAQASLSVSGGINAPVGVLGDLFDLGYHIAVGLNAGGVSAPIALRFEGAYSDLAHKNRTTDVRLLIMTANVVFNTDDSNDAPYLIGGIGVYNRSFSTSTTGYGTGKTAIGINGGGGLRFPLSGLSTFVEARYHMMLGDSANDTNYQFIPITFGIAF